MRLCDGCTNYDDDTDRCYRYDDDDDDDDDFLLKLLPLDSHSRVNSLY